MATKVSEPATTTEDKPKRTRRPSEPKPIHLVFNILDENGEVDTAFDKGRIHFIEATADGNVALEAMDTNKGANYLRVMPKKK